MPIHPALQPGIDAISVTSPSWSLKLEDHLSYREEYRSYPPRDPLYLLSLYHWRKERGTTRILSRSIALEPRKRWRGRTAHHFLLEGGGRTTYRLRNVLQDGACLNCGEVNPFLFEQDHPIGRDSDMVITLCANCHRLKTSGRFWLSDWRLK